MGRTEVERLERDQQPGGAGDRVVADLRVRAVRTHAVELVEATDEPALDDRGLQQRALQGDRVGGPEHLGQGAGAGAALLLVDREGHDGGERGELDALLAQQPQGEQAGDGAALVVDGAEAVQVVAVQPDVARDAPGRRDGVDVGDHGQHGRRGAAEHQVVGPAGGRDAPRRQVERAGSRLEVVDDGVLRP